MDVLIGADPEVFVFDKGVNEYICGEGFIPGTKEEPFQVPAGAIQVDGMALEFNIDPAATVTEFVGNVVQVFGTLKMRLKDLSPNLDLHAVPVADFNPDYFENEVSIFAKQLGCTPDYDAYSMRQNPPPEGERPFRTGSGHIHIGWTHNAKIYSREHMEACGDIVRIMDHYLALPSCLWDKDKRRRELYGNIGCFRTKSYGVEYRVLSNAWLRDERLIRYVYQQARAGVEAYEAGLRISPDTYERVFRLMNSDDETIMRVLRNMDINLPPEECWE